MKKQRGFTIVELLIYMGLLMILMTIVTRLFTATIDVQLTSEAIGGLEEDSRYIYSRLAYDIARADSITVPGVPGSSSNTLTIMVGSVPYTYSLSGTNLMLGSESLNSYMTGISNLTFTLLGPDDGKKSIQVKYTVTSTIQSSSGSVSRNIETTITQR